MEPIEIIVGELREDWHKLRLCKAVDIKNEEQERMEKQLCKGGLYRELYKDAVECEAKVFDLKALLKNSGYDIDKQENKILPVIKFESRCYVLNKELEDHIEKCKSPY